MVARSVRGAAPPRLRRVPPGPAGHDRFLGHLAAWHRRSRTGWPSARYRYCGGAGRGVARSSTVAWLPPSGREGAPPDGDGQRKRGGDCGSPRHSPPGRRVSTSTTPRSSSSTTRGASWTVPLGPSTGPPRRSATPSPSRRTIGAETVAPPPSQASRAQYVGATTTVFYHRHVAVRATRDRRRFPLDGRGAARTRGVSPLGHRAVCSPLRSSRARQRRTRSESAIAQSWMPSPPIAEARPW